MMKPVLSFISLLLFSLNTLSQEQPPHNYYVDFSAPVNGDGSMDSPWNTFSSVNNRTFHAGDSILLKQGTIATGELFPKGSGKENAPITISSYGVGPKPIINAEGKENSAAIRLNNQEYWTIENMEVTNNTTTLGTRWGIYVYADDGQIKHGIHLLNNTVRNVYASYIRTPSREIQAPSFYHVGGIYVKIEEPGRIDDLLIENNHLTDIVGIGICFWGESEKVGDMNWDNLSTNVVIRGNSVIRTGADGILILGTDNELIEYNRVHDAGYWGQMGDVPGKSKRNGTDVIAGLWPTRHRDGLVQYNEVSNTRQFYSDGQAFDNDLYVQGTTIFQYNYSHDNEGGFFLDCCGPESTNEGTIIRYNISQNDGKYNYLRLTKGSAQIYNNVFYAADTIIMNGSNENFFYNNIFWGKHAEWNNNTLEHNAYYGGLTPPDTDHYKVIADPQLVYPGSGSDGFKTLKGYQLEPSSPAKAKGKIIPNNGGKDFWGNAVPDSLPPNIGVDNEVSQ